LRSEYTDVASRVPQGALKSAVIAHDVPDGIAILRASMHGMPLERRTYVRLLIDGDVAMTDAHFERLSNLGYAESSVE